jgi:hypothetical protein
MARSPAALAVRSLAFAVTIGASADLLQLLQPTKKTFLSASQ